MLITKQPNRKINPSFKKSLNIMLCIRHGPPHQVIIITVSHSYLHSKHRPSSNTVSKAVSQGKQLRECN